MDRISASELAKYEAILVQIDEEHKKNAKLKKDAESEVSKLMVVRVALEENFTRDNVFRVLVKVFPSLFSLFYVYNEQIPHGEFEILRRAESNAKFYLVEVCVSKLFGAKIFSAGQRWLLNVCVKNSKSCVSKNVPVSKTVSDRIFVVVPFDDSTEPSTVTCKLFMPLGHIWSVIKIATVDVDISYHFNLPENSLSQRPRPGFNLDLPKTEYSFKCSCNVKHFFEAIVKNCYQNLNARVFGAFSSNESNSEVVLKFTVDSDTQNNTEIVLRQSQNRLDLASNPGDLRDLKKYLIRELRCQNFCLDKMWFVGLKNLKTYLQIELGKEELQPETLKIYHEEFRKLMFELPV